MYVTLAYKTWDMPLWPSLVRHLTRNEAIPSSSLGEGNFFW